ncbi:MarR family winged helix-turn-helix transcriptional regulator [Micromonospora sp. NBC_01796]|uniref:MarR family winged helix-turn-helix transcriptional regulator n=1 Tax=Micromonospora sp. NBC_01796 TaxID=2975987 RepID=UPI002DDB43FE|nr:MarR family transcriptional regulator [Micromonospora sp. NBC_01796]WSA83721.1 MarR family transcriptional regulator [Micromonospora sp. NBC_01796]
MTTTEAPDPLWLAQELRLNIDRLRRTVRNRRTLDGMPRRHESVLSWLRRKGPLSTAELARWEQIRPQSMGTTVAELLVGGLVTKSPDPTDGRRELVSLTDAGVRTLASIAEQRDRDLAALIESQLTEPERLVVLESLVLLERVAGQSG